MTQRQVLRHGNELFGVWEDIRQFAKRHLLSQQPTRADREERLPWVHMAIGNLTTYSLGVLSTESLGTSAKYLDEFFYRFNQYFWEPVLPLRLLKCLYEHVPARLLAENG